MALTGLQASTACTSYPTSESPAHAVDGTTATKFTCFTGTADLVVQMNASATFTVGSYDITTADEIGSVHPAATADGLDANGNPQVNPRSAVIGTDPRGWTFSCRSSADEPWRMLHKVTNYKRVMGRETSYGGFPLNRHCVVKKPPPTSSSSRATSRWTAPPASDLKFFPGGCAPNSTTRQFSLAPLPYCVRIVTEQVINGDNFPLKVLVAETAVGFGYAWPPTWNVDISVIPGDIIDPYTHNLCYAKPVTTIIHSHSTATSWVGRVEYSENGGETYAPLKW